MTLVCIRTATHRAVLCLAVGLSLPRAAGALEVISIDVSYRADGFHVALDARIDAPIASVERVLRGYNDYPALDARIREARVLERLDSATLLLFTRLRACAGIFCRSVQRVERVEERPHELLALTIASRSDLETGWTHTILVDDGDGTRVEYRSTFQPDFWVPHFIAAGLALRTLQLATVELFRNLEARARTAATS